MQFDAVQEAVGVWRKLFERRSWLIGAPYIASMLLLVAIFFLAFGLVLGPEFLRAITSGNVEAWQPDQSFIIRMALMWCFAFIAILVVTTFVNGWMLAAAEPVWRGADPAFDRGFNRAAEKLLPLVAYTLLVALMAIVSLITIVGPIVVAFLAMYGYAFILFDGKSATEAIGASFKLASEQVAPTIVLVLAFIVITILAFVLQLIFSWIPLVNVIVQIGVNWLLYAYYALGIVRFYQLLRSNPSTIPIVPPTSV